MLVIVAKFSPSPLQIIPCWLARPDRMGAAFANIHEIHSGEFVCGCCAQKTGILPGECQTLRAPYLERRLPESSAGGAGARPDHPISRRGVQSGSRF
jgi:hypothetical protein